MGQRRGASRESLDCAGQDIGSGICGGLYERGNLMGFSIVVVIHEKQVLSSGMPCPVISGCADIIVFLPDDTPPFSLELRL